MYMLLRDTPMPTAPTTIMRPRSRKILAAISAGSAESVAAVKIAASTPYLENSVMLDTSIGSLAGIASCAPNSAARWTRWGERSMATTRHPAARAIWIVNTPTSPAPITATASPMPTLACRKPCIAMAPIVVKEAAAIDTCDGICTARLRGTKLISAWLAYVPPPQATRSPARNSCTPSPTEITSPEQLYPSVVSVSSFACTFSYPAFTPFWRAYSITCLTRSGRALALARSDFELKSSVARSVPTLIAEYWVRTRSPPGRNSGAGISYVATSPEFLSVKSARMSSFRVRTAHAISRRAVQDLVLMSNTARVTHTSRYAPDRHAGCHTQDRLSSAFGSALPRAAWNEDDIVWLELQIRSLCGQNFLKREGDFFRALWGFANEPGRVQSRVRVGALSEGNSLQHGNIIAIFHDKTAGLADLADDVNDARLVHDNCVAGIDSVVILHRLRRTSQKQDPNRVLRIIAPRNQHIAAGFRSSTAGDGYGVVEISRAQQRINAGFLYL